MRQPVITGDSTLAASLDGYRRALTQTAAAQAVEASARQRIINDAQDEGLSLRDIAALTGIPRATIARALKPRTPSGPHPHYSESEWIAAHDRAWIGQPQERRDRGPWKAEHGPDGSTTHQAIAEGTYGLAGPGAGTIRELQGNEPLQGLANWEILALTDCLATPDPTAALAALPDRVVRRLALVVLRTLHPGLVREDGLVDAALKGVMADPLGALVLIGAYLPTPSEIPAKRLRLLGERANSGFYLP